MIKIELALAQYAHEKEYRFHPTRKWRFDYALPAFKIAIEFEGGVWSRGRHTRGAGYTKDCEKYNQAALLGWVVLRYTAGNVDQCATDLKYLMTKNAKDKS